MPERPETMSRQVQDKNEEIWESVREGNPRSLEILFQKHYSRLYDYGLKLSGHEELVKDTIQEVFAYLWEKRRGINISSMNAYLLVSLRRRLLASLAKQHKRKLVDKEFTIEQVKEAFSIEELVIFQETKDEERHALKTAFKKMPTRIREALYLKTYDGLTYKEIASIMNVRPQVARNYVSEAFQRLRGLVK